MESAMEIDEARSREIQRFVETRPPKKVERQRAAPVWEAIKALVTPIETLRGKGYTWNEIALILREFGVISTGGTIRQYYAKAIKRGRAERGQESLQNRLQRQRNQTNHKRLH